MSNSDTADKLVEVQRALEAEIADLLDKVAAKRKALQHLKDTISLIWGAKVEVPLSDKPKPKRRQNVYHARKNPPYSLHEVQTALVEYASGFQKDSFTTADAISYLLARGVLKAATSTATQDVRKLLKDTTFFERVGKLQNTRWRAAQ
jgi:hypothetical protein